MIGYSKFIGDAECIDRVNTLMSKIEFLMINWIDRSTKIEIFRKEIGRDARDKFDPIVITLYPNDCMIPVENIPKIPQDLRLFLESIYKNKKAGLNLKGLRSAPDHTFSKDSIFEFSKHNFTRLIDLLSWCELQIANGFPRPQVENFYRNYSSKFLLS